MAWIASACDALGKFDPDAIRRLKADPDRDINVDGPELAEHAIKAGVVDKLQIIVYVVIVGGGKKFFANAVRLHLELIDERRFRCGVVVLRYAGGG